jgi:hypothetical protein
MLDFMETVNQTFKERDEEKAIWGMLIKHLKMQGL